MLTNLNILELTAAEYSENKTWMIIHTKSRREKKIAQYCNSTNIKYYLPLETRIKIYGRKKVQTSLPLFPGYLFCIADEKEREKFRDKLENIVRHQFYMLFSPLGAIFIYQLLIMAKAADQPVTVAIAALGAGSTINILLDKAVSASRRAMGKLT